jgi:ankyrin repeat protein
MDSTNKDPIIDRLLSIGHEQGEMGEETSDVQSLRISQIGKEAIQNKEWEDHFTKTGFDQMLALWTVPIPKDSLLKGLDLIIFKDDFPGNLPLNGIRKTDFDQWNHKYEEICQNRTRLKIVGNDAFRQQMLRAIETMISRRLGRNLLDKVIFEKSKLQEVTLCETDQASAATQDIYRPVISINTKQKYLIITQINGRKIAVERALHMIVFHEMAHVSHAEEIEKEKRYEKEPTLHPKMSNIEEQITITGKGENFGFQSTQPTSNLSEEESEWMPYEVIGYDEINENAFGSVVGQEARLHHSVIVRPLESSDLYSEEVKKFVLRCVRLGLVEEIKPWIKKGFDLNMTLDSGSSFIREAIKNKELEMLTFLIENGADPNQLYKGESALHFAIKKQSLPAIKILLEKGAKEDLEDAEGDTSLIKATESNQEIMRFLLDRQATSQAIHMRDKNGRSLIERAASNGNDEVVKLLLERGAQPTQRLLNDAMSTNFLGILSLVFDKNLDVINNEGNTPLQQALISFESSLYESPYPLLLDQLNLLIDKGANINLANQQGQTILHAIALFKNSDFSLHQKKNLIQHFISRGADPHLPDKNGMTVFDLWKEEYGEDLDIGSST